MYLCDFEITILKWDPGSGLMLMNYSISETKASTGWENGSHNVKLPNHKQKKISWDYYLPKKVTPPPSVKLHLVPSTNWEEENNL